MKTVSYIAMLGITLLVSVCNGPIGLKPYDLVPVVQSPARVVVCVGDSITEGWNATPYVVYLRERMNMTTVINSGHGGYQSGQLLGRYPDDVTVYRPDLVVIMMGTNDIYFNTPLEVAENNIDMMASWTVNNKSIPVLCTQIPRPGQFNDSQNVSLLELNNWIRDYCADNNYQLIDFYAAMEDPITPGTANYSVCVDGVHPSSYGAMLMADSVNISIFGYGV